MSYCERIMSAPLRNLPILARIILLAGLFCGVALGQAGYSQSPLDSCVVSGSPGNHAWTAPADRHPCCAAMPCCLVSRHSANSPVLPEPLSNNGGHSLAHAQAAVTLILLGTFDFLAPPKRLGVVAGRRVAPLALGSAPRGAVSCIWLI
jgi:hypothetical protein